VVDADTGEMTGAFPANSNSTAVVLDAQHNASLGE
jgi:hypothetical protein